MSQPNYTTGHAAYHPDPMRPGPTITSAPRTITQPTQVFNHDAAMERIAELERENAKLKKQLIDLLMVAKTWHLVWHDKFAPASNAEFERIEREILSQKS